MLFFRLHGLVLRVDFPLRTSLYGVNGLPSSIHCIMLLKGSVVGFGIGLRFELSATDLWFCLGIASV